MLCRSIDDCSYLFLGTEIIINQNKPWCVLVVTGVMTRAQSLPTADELVFIDSSSSCDATQSTVTTVLVASTAGAIPVAVLIHEGQSAESYEAAFSLLRQHHSQCFNGREVCENNEIGFEYLEGHISVPIFGIIAFAKILFLRGCQFTCDNANYTI